MSFERAGNNLAVESWDSSLRRPNHPIQLSCNTHRAISWAPIAYFPLVHFSAVHLLRAMHESRHGVALSQSAHCRFCTSRECWLLSKPPLLLLLPFFFFTRNCKGKYIKATVNYTQTRWILRANAIMPFCLCHQYSVSWTVLNRKLHFLVFLSVNALCGYAMWRTPTPGIFPPAQIQIFNHKFVILSLWLLPNFYLLNAHLAHT